MGQRYRRAPRVLAQRPSRRTGVNLQRRPRMCRVFAYLGDLAYLGDPVELDGRCSARRTH